MASSDNVTPLPVPLEGFAAHDRRSELERQTMRRVTMRLIPFLFILYMLNILDRINIGFAKLQFLDDLGMTETTFARALSVFYIGYFLFEVPSNLIMKRIGARRWIGRIVISWGAVSAAMMFVTKAWGFYLLRILLGLAEAGFFPGIILFVSYWFPARYRARAVSTFMAASALTGMIGGPVSGGIMHYLDKTAGLSGWQWLFLLEGIPTVIMGCVALVYLTDRPAKATWLPAPERDWLVERMAREEASRVQHHGFTLLQGLTNPRVLLLCAIYFTVSTGSNGYGNYYPSILRGNFPDFNEFQLGLVSSIPSVFAVISMLLVARHSDRTGERRWHVGGPACFAAVGWVIVAQAQSPYLVVLGMAMAQAGMMSMLAPFWALPTSFLSGSAAAGGIAFINSVGNLGGFVGPPVIAWAKDNHGSYSIGFLFLAGILVIGAVLVQLARHDRKLESHS